MTNWARNIYNSINTRLLNRCGVEDRLSLYACTRLLNCAFMNSFKYLKMRGPRPRLVLRWKRPLCRNHEETEFWCQARGCIFFSYPKFGKEEKRPGHTTGDKRKGYPTAPCVSLSEEKRIWKIVYFFSPSGVHIITSLSVSSFFKILNQDWGSPLQKWCLLSVQDHKVPLLKCKASEGLFTCTGMIDIPAKTHTCSHFIHADWHSPFTVNERPLLFGTAHIFKKIFQMS